ncbi:MULTISPECIES: hypothetical protein [unclassified Microcoleus]|uniref:hypothetical protein n=1 Tax=unclassified Microcoleus TaxID=2642155 RepID=UPI002FCEB8E0
MNIKFYAWATRTAGSDFASGLGSWLYASLGRMLSWQKMLFETKAKASLREICTAIMLHFLSQSGIRSRNASE